MAPTRTGGLLQIGDVAERTGLSLRTVRYYEEVGVLPAADRSPGGFRLYDEHAVQRLLVVKRLTPLELTLDEVREVVDLLDGPPRNDEDRDRLTRYRARVETSMSMLESRLTDARELADRLDALLAP